MNETLADLYRQIGLQSAWQGTPENQPGYRPPRPMPRQMRPLEQRLYDPNQGVRSQAGQEMRQQRTLGALPQQAAGGYSGFADRNQVEEFGRGALEMTGAPSWARGIQDVQHGRPGEAIPEFLMGALNTAGIATLPLGGGARLPTRPMAPTRAIANDGNIIPRRLPPSSPSETLDDLVDPAFGVRRAPAWAPDDWALSQRGDGMFEPPANLRGQDGLSAYERAEVQRQYPRSPEQRASERWADNRAPPPAGSANVPPQRPPVSERLDAGATGAGNAVEPTRPPLTPAETRLVQTMVSAIDEMNAARADIKRILDNPYTIDRDVLEETMRTGRFALRGEVLGPEAAPRPAGLIGREAPTIEGEFAPVAPNARPPRPPPNPPQRPNR